MMTWNQFFVTLVTIYCIYYSMNMLFDLLGRKAKKIYKEDADTLFFSEHTQPVIIDEAEQQQEEKEIDQDPNHSFGGQILGTGAVSIKGLFKLVREEAIEFTRAIPY